MRYLLAIIICTAIVGTMINQTMVNQPIVDVQAQTQADSEAVIYIIYCNQELTYVMLMLGPMVLGIFERESGAEVTQVELIEKSRAIFAQYGITKPKVEITATSACPDGPGMLSPETTQPYHGLKVTFSPIPNPA